MKILSKLQRKEEVREFFLSLLLKPYSIAAILFEKKGDNLILHATKEEIIHKEIDDLSTAELVEESDRVISAVEASLPPETELRNTIFTVPYSWVTDGKIKPDFLERLKKDCEDLDLKPIGFIVYVEAIAALLQQKEGVPLSAIIIESAKEKLFVYFVRSGQVVSFMEGEMTEDLPKSVENLLKQMDVSALPNRMVLLTYDGGEKLQQEFMAFPWNKDLPFHHLPKIDILEKGFENDAVVHGVAAQMGSDLADDFQENEQPGIQSVPAASRFEETDAAEFGFVKEKDVLQESVEKKEVAENEHENIVPVEDAEPKIKTYDGDVTKTANEPYEEKDAGDTNKQLLSGVAGLFSVSGLKKSMISLFQIPKKGLRFSSLPFGVGFILAPILLIVLILVVGYVYYSYVLKTEVVILADNKTFSESTPVTFDSEEPTSVVDGVINMEIIEEEVSGEESRETSGTKETGDKATGEVTVFNKTEQRRTFEKGTILIGSNDLEFVLIDEVQVASTSPFATNFASTKAKVEAAEFGKDYNLPSNTNFTFEDFPTSNYFARNENAFSGGSSREVQVVAPSDIEELEESLLDSLSKKAAESARSKVGEDKELLEMTLGEEFSEQEYSKKAGDEASSLSLSATVVLRIGSYKKQDLIDLAKGLSVNDVPDYYELDANKTGTEITDVEIDDDVVTAEAHVDAVYVPKIDAGSLVNDINFSRESKAIEEIKKINGVRDVTIVSGRKIPGFPNLLPLRASQITIEVRTNE